MLIGIVNSIVGRVLISDSQGVVRHLQIGDSIHSGDIISSKELSSKITLSSGRLIDFQQQAQWLFSENGFAKVTELSSLNEAVVKVVSTETVGSQRSLFENLELSQATATVVNTQSINPENVPENELAERQVLRVDRSQEIAGRIAREALEVLPSVITRVSKEASIARESRPSFHSQFDQLDYNSSHQTFKDAFYRLFANNLRGSLSALQALGVAGLNTHNIEGAQHHIVKNIDDGKSLDSLDKVQDVVNAVLAAFAEIQSSAEQNDASVVSLLLQNFTIIGIQGIDQHNHALINSVLNTALVGANQVQSVSQIQLLVDSYNQLLSGADELDNNNVNLTRPALESLGAASLNVGGLVLFNHIVDEKSAADISPISKVLAIAQAVANVMQVIAGSGVVIKEELELLGVDPIVEIYMPAIHNALSASADDGSEIPNIVNLQALINAAIVAADASLLLISTAAENDTATALSPSVEDYLNIGMSGVDANNLAALNTVLNEATIGAFQVDSFVEVQFIVDSYNQLLMAADGLDDQDQKATQQNYQALGIFNIDSPVKVSLMGDVIDIQQSIDVDSVAKLKALAQAVNAVFEAAAGGVAVSLAQLQLLGVTDVTVDSLALVQQAIASSANDGSEVQLLTALQQLATAAAESINDAIAVIVDAAENNSAIAAALTLSQYSSAIVTGVSSSNLAALNSVLDSANITGAEVNSSAKIQALVDSYQIVLDAADGVYNGAAKPSIEDYSNLGVVGVDTPFKAHLLGGSLDLLNNADVDSYDQLQALADAVAAVLTGAAGGVAPTFDQLISLGLNSVTTENLAAQQQAIAGTPVDGSGVQSILALQSLLGSTALAFIAALTALTAAADANDATASTPSVNDYKALAIVGVEGANLANINGILNTANVVATDIDSVAELQQLVDSYLLIVEVADSNTATAVTPTVADYSVLGITGVSASNLAQLNQVLNTSSILGEDVDSAVELQQMVDSYQRVLDAADGVHNNAVLPAAADYARLGITGIDSAEKVLLMGQAIDLKNATEIDSIAKLQLLSAAVQGVMDGASGIAGVPTIAQLTLLGVAGVNSENIGRVQLEIAATVDDGSAVDNLPALRLIATNPPLVLDLTDTAGITLNLINPVVTADGKVYYYVDNSGNGLSGTGDLITRGELSALLNGGTDTQDTQLSGAVEGVDDARTVIVDGYTIILPTIAEFRALYKDPIDDAPAGWKASAYWSSTNSFSNFYDYIHMGSGSVSSTSLTGGFYIAFQVLYQDRDAALEKISSAAGLDNAAATILLSDYQALNIQGVNTANLAAVNSALDTAPIDASATDTFAKVQVIVADVVLNMAIAKIEDYNNGDGSTPPALVLQDYLDAAVSGVSSDNLAAVNALILASSSGDTDSAAEIQALVTILNSAITKIEAYNIGNGTSPPALVLQDYLDAGISGITGDNLAAVNAQILAAVPGAADTVSEIQSLVNAADAALSNIEAYNNGNGTSPPALILQDFLEAGITGVTSDNIAAANAQILAAATGAANSNAEIQSLITAADLSIANIEAYNNGNGVSPAALIIQDFADAGVTGVSADNLAAVNAQILASVPNAADSVPEIQSLVAAADTAIAKVEAYNNGNGSSPAALVLQDFLEDGITGVTSDNIAAANAQILAATTGAANSTAEIQSLIAAADVAIANIEAYNTGNGTAPPALVLQDFLEAGITGVSSDNIAAANAQILAAATGGADSNAEIQSLIAAADVAIGKIEAYNNGNGTSPAALVVQDFIDAGITGVSAVNVAAVNAQVLASVSGDTDTVPEIQTLVAVANTAIAKIEAYNNGNGTSPAALVLQDYLAAGVTGVSIDNLAAANAQILAAATGATDSNAEIQSLITAADDAIGKIEAYNNGNGVSPVALVLQDYLAAGIIGVSIDNLAAANAQILAAATGAADSNADIQSLITAADVAIAKIEAYNNGNGTSPAALVVQDFIDAGVTGVSADNLAAMNAQVLASVSGDTDTVPEIQALVAVADTAIAKIEAYNNGNGTSPPALVLQDYFEAGITGVSIDNIVAVNTQVLASVTGDTDTVAEIQAQVVAADNAIAKIEAYNNGNGTSPAALFIQDFIDAGVTGVSVDNIAPNNAQVLVSVLGDTDTVPEIQVLVAVADAVIAKIEAYNNGDGITPPALVLQDYLAAGVAGVNSDNIGVVIAQILAAAPGVADTVPEIQVKVTLVNQAIAKIEAYNNGNGTSPAALIIEDFTAAGITGVSAENLAAVNAQVLASILGAANTVSEIQGLVSAADAATAKIEDYNNGDGSSPAALTVQDYLAAGITGVSTDNVSALNAQVLASVANATDTVAEIQALVIAANAAIAKIEAYNNGNGTLPAALVLQDYIEAGISEVNSDNLAVINAQILASAPGDTDTVPEIQAKVTLVTTAIAKIEAYNNGNGTVPAAPVLQDYLNAGVNGVSQQNLAGVNALVLNAISGAADTTAEIQAIVNAVVVTTINAGSTLLLQGIEDGAGEGYKVDGLAGNQQLGYTVSNAGDVNGDGYDDVLMTSRQGANGRGAAYEIFGSASGAGNLLDTNDIGGAIAGFAINVEATKNALTSISSAGDLNDDGLADIIVGTSSATGSDAVAHVIYGKTSTTTVELSALGSGGFTINNPSATLISHRVSNIGDINADGFDDVIVSQAGSTGNGEVYVIYGSASGVDILLSDIANPASTNGFKIFTLANTDYTEISGAGDVNGDGIADLVVGDREGNGGGGEVYIIYGQAGNVRNNIDLNAFVAAPSLGFSIKGSTTDSNFEDVGASVAEAGDVNGDGFADIIIGNPFSDLGGSNAGIAFVVFGKSNITEVDIVALSSDANTEGFSIVGSAPNGFLGNANTIHSAGDVNGDGLDDLILGYYKDTYVVYGKMGGASIDLANFDNGTTSQGFLISSDSIAGGDRLAVSGGGDINGDGFDDLIIGSGWSDQNGTSSGSTYVIYGAADAGDDIYFGSANDDSLIGNVGANRLIGKQGNDILIGNGGADVMRGGEGDDVLAISDLNFAVVDGGSSGTDTLRFDVALTADFTTISDNRMVDIEVIDLTQDGGNSSITLNLTDVLNLSSSTTIANTLTILGSAGDQVELNDISAGGVGLWVETGASTSVYEFISAGNVLATVTVASAVATNLVTPLILDLDGDGIETLSFSEGVRFDIDADGTLNQTGWVGADDGLLVRDLNGDGIINDASELFGEHTLKDDSTKASDGFAALSELDSNSDGVMNSLDDSFDELKVWRDLNSDGITQQGELFSLAEAGVSEISLNSEITNVDSNGNTVGLLGHYIDSSGARQQLADVWFEYQAKLSVGLSTETNATETNSTAINSSSNSAVISDADIFTEDEFDFASIKGISPAITEVSVATQEIEKLELITYQGGNGLLDELPPADIY